MRTSTILLYLMLLVGLAFQYYFSTALYSFSAKIRNEQLLGTLEAMLVSPTPTSMVIFSSAAWDFTYGAIRLILYLIFATLVFRVQRVDDDRIVLGVNERHNVRANAVLLQVPDSGIQGLTIAVGIGLLGAAYPAYRAARLMPTEALRHG